MKITLLRHGKPTFELVGKVPARDLKEVARLYDSAGIVGAPPGEIIQAIQGHTIVVCSHLPRSLDSAKALGLTDIHCADPLFAEMAMPHFGSGAITLPIGVWMFILRSLWLLGFSRNGESFADARRRAKQAAQRLIQLAGEYGTVLLVGHGFINYFIARELLASGWVGPAKPGRGFWEYGVYQGIAI